MAGREIVTLRWWRTLYKPGDIVRVRSRKEIAPYLDDFAKADGCLFMPRMACSCGKTYKVVKVVNNFYDEYRAEMYPTRVPLYILERSICDGDMGELALRCDRSCYYLWHENWLENTD
jgi:hypothetical protein